MKFIIGFLFICVVLWLLLELVKRKTAMSKGKKFKNSKTLQEIQNYIFRDGAPSQINITSRNEIFFGPTNGSEFARVPSEMVPQMTYDDQWALGYELAARTGYTIHNKSERNLKITGNDYIDDALTVQLITRGQSTARW